MSEQNVPEKEEIRPEEITSDQPDTQVVGSTPTPLEPNETSGEVPDSSKEPNDSEPSVNFQDKKQQLLEMLIGYDENIDQKKELFSVQAVEDLTRIKEVLQEEMPDVSDEEFGKEYMVRMEQYFFLREVEKEAVEQGIKASELPGDILTKIWERVGVFFAEDMVKDFTEFIRVGIKNSDMKTLIDLFFKSSPAYEGGDHAEKSSEEELKIDEIKTAWQNDRNKFVHFLRLIPHYVGENQISRVSLADYPPNLKDLKSKENVDDGEVERALEVVLREYNDNNTREDLIAVVSTATTRSVRPNAKEALKINDKDVLGLLENWKNVLHDNKTIW